MRDKKRIASSSEIGSWQYLVRSAGNDDEDDDEGEDGKER